MRCVVRDDLTQLVGLWFFGEIEDSYSFLMFFIRLKFMLFYHVTMDVNELGHMVYIFFMDA